MNIDSVLGSYALILWAKSPFQTRIGKLGLLNGRSGHYIYVGTAFGPGGLRARLGHHLKLAALPHWHIDYLRQILPITEIWYTYNGHQKYEHQWANVLLNMSGSSIPLPRFGASDCSCPAHLFHFRQAPNWQDIQAGTDTMVYMVAKPTSKQQDRLVSDWQSDYACC